MSNNPAQNAPAATEEPKVTEAPKVINEAKEENMNNPAQNAPAKPNAPAKKAAKLGLTSVLMQIKTQRGTATLEAKGLPAARAQFLYGYRLVKDGADPRYYEIVRAYLSGEITEDAAMARVAELAGSGADRVEVEA